MSADLTYDYAIIGAGAAGLNIALAMQKDAWFDDKKILILEKSAKDQNDKTWSFWEQGEGMFDSIVTKRWSSAKFLSDKVDLQFDLSPYSYKTVRALDFYAYAQEILAKAPNFTWLQSGVLKVSEGEPVRIDDANSSYLCKHAFDSRMGPEFANNTSRATTILQHFKGWVIESETAVFEVDAFTMMDYRVKWKDSTSFTYVLPFSPTRALIEFTLFTPELIKEDEYTWGLEKYIKEVLGLASFKIVEEENGVIPMSSFAFHKLNTKHVTRIGTAGGWVKPGSGYSFNNAQLYSAKMVSNLKSGIRPDKGLIRKRSRFLDSLFLDVLYKNNELGEEIFEQMYSRNSIHDIFAFLDDQTNLLQDIRIISKFRSKPFLAALGRYIAG